MIGAALGWPVSSSVGQGPRSSRRLLPSLHLVACGGIQRVWGQKDVRREGGRGLRVLQGREAGWGL